MKVECQICHEKLNQVNWKHLEIHNITIDTYKMIFPNDKLLSDETWEKRSSIRKNKCQTENCKQKISKNRKGKGIGNKNSIGRIPWNKNKKLSEEIGRKISKANKGRPSPMKGKHHTEEVKERLRQYIGERASNWRGGISEIRYCRKFNKELKNEIIKRDNYQCQHPDCLSTQLESLLLYNRKLLVHHVHYDKENCYPDLITLCLSHNTIANFNRESQEKLYMKILKEKNLLNYFGDIK